MIEQYFCASEGYDITCSVPALCKPHKSRLFSRLNIHDGIAKCYAVECHFWGWEYKLSTIVFSTLQIRTSQGFLAPYCVTHYHRLRAQVVYPFAPSWLPNSKDGKSRQGREARSLSLTAFPVFAIHRVDKSNLLNICLSFSRYRICKAFGSYRALFARLCSMA